MSDNYVLDILLSEDDNNYMNTGFSKKQWDSLQKLINGYHHPPAAPPQQSPASPSTSPSAPLAAPPAALQTSPPAQVAQPAPAAPPTAPPAAPLPAQPPASPPAQKPATPAYLSHEQVDRWLQMLEKCQTILAAASPPAHKPAVSIPSELTPQPITVPVPTRSYPPPPSVETIKEVEQKQVYNRLRNVKQMRQKFGSARKMPKTRVSEYFGNHIEWPTKFGGIYMCFSRDEDLDAWYTTMLNHKQKLYQSRLSPMRADATVSLRFGIALFR